MDRLMDQVMDWQWVVKCCNKSLLRGCNIYQTKLKKAYFYRIYYQTDAISEWVNKCYVVDILPIQCSVGNVPLTIMQFNWAETTNVPNYDSSGIDPGTNFYEAVIKKHKIRTKIATKKILDNNQEKKMCQETESKKW